MKIGGPVISAAAHGVVLAGVTFFLKSEARPVSAMIELFSAAEPVPVASAATVPVVPQPQPQAMAAPPMIVKSSPRQASVLAKDGAKARASLGPSNTGAAALNLDLTLDGDDSTAGPGAVVFAAGSGALDGTADGKVSGGAGVVRDGTALRANACPGGVQRPVPISRVAFLYPPGAPGLAGTIQAQIEVSETGAIQHINLVRPVSAEVDRAAIATLSRWRFAPAKRCGVAVAGDYVVVLRLELSD